MKAGLVEAVDDPDLLGAGFQPFERQREALAGIETASPLDPRLRETIREVVAWSRCRSLGGDAEARAAGLREAG